MTDMPETKTIPFSTLLAYSATPGAIITDLSSDDNVSRSDLRREQSYQIVVGDAVFEYIGRRPKENERERRREISEQSKCLSEMRLALSESYERTTKLLEKMTEMADVFQRSAISNIETANALQQALERNAEHPAVAIFDRIVNRFENEIRLIGMGLGHGLVEKAMSANASQSATAPAVDNDKKVESTVETTIEEMSNV